MTDTLFELRDDDQIRTDAIHLNRLRIHDAQMGRGPWKLKDRQHRLLTILGNRQGRRMAINISELTERLGCGPREIKADVRDLVISFELPIVASRDGEGGGYFFATTAEERTIYSADYLKEAVALIRRAQVIRNESDVNVLLGQLVFDPKQGDVK